MGIIQKILIFFAKSADMVDLWVPLGSPGFVHSLGTSFIKKIKLDSRFDNLEHKKISITWSL